MLPSTAVSMETDFFAVNSLIKGSSFANEGTKEFYFSVHSGEEATFQDELDSLYTSYITAMERMGLSEDTLVFGRFYLSDIANQKPLLRKSPIFRALRKGAVSTIQQCPIDGGSVSLLVYHIKNCRALDKKIVTYDSSERRNSALIHGRHYDMLWLANFTGVGTFDSHAQTMELFDSFTRILKENDMTMLDNAVRTWIYVRDIDNHYEGMVRARREFFLKYGLTPDSRYIASTGIEGFSSEVNSLVAFDAYAIKPLQPGQIVRMEAPGNMSPTIRYGVTFERGTRIRYGDRSHLHISGTASIDSSGEIMHVGDVSRQTARTIENVRALLEPQGAGLSDMAYIIAYIRDPKDHLRVLDVLSSEIPESVPIVFLEGSVCRPAWLVELEGIAVIPDSTDYPSFF